MSHASRRPQRMPGRPDVIRVLLVDDVGTWGSTLSCALSALRAAGIEAPIVAATAGLMMTKSAVADEAQVLARWSRDA